MAVLLAELGISNSGAATASVAGPESIPVVYGATEIVLGAAGGALKSGTLANFSQGVGFLNIPFSLLRAVAAWDNGTGPQQFAASLNLVVSILTVAFAASMGPASLIAAGIYFLADSAGAVEALASFFHQRFTDPRFGNNAEFYYGRQSR